MSFWYIYETHKKNSQNSKKKIQLKFKSFHVLLTFFLFDFNPAYLWTKANDVKVFK